MTRDEERAIWKIRTSEYFKAGKLSLKRKQLSRVNYKVKLQFSTKNFSCECMDWNIRKKYCKHIAYTLIRKFQ